MTPEDLSDDDRSFNRDMAERFRRAAALLDEQGADPFRVRAYLAAADTLDHLVEPVSAVYRREGLPGLVAIPTIGSVLATAIADVSDTGRWHWLDRLEGTADPEQVFATVAGIGPVLANRIHDELGIESLEELERAASDGRLAGVEGFGPKRVRAVLETLDARLRYRPGIRYPDAHGRRDEPSTREILDIDAEYRLAAAARRLPMIAPRRFNPDGEAWLPILHTSRGPHHYTVLYSNSARAHQLGRTDDWVVIYAETPDQGTWTVATETRGPDAGRRVVRGRAG